MKTVVLTPSPDPALRYSTIVSWVLAVALVGLYALCLVSR